MKKSFILTLLTIITLGLFQPATALAEESQKLPSGIERDQIGQKIQDYVKEHEKTTAGMATAVFDKDGTIYQGNFGYMNKEKGVKADDGSVFEWGSVTKLTVWISVMQLWEQGKINLEEDIRTYLPEGFLKNLRYDKPITMLDLMNHQAGFDEVTMYLQDDKSIEEILQEQQPIQSFEPGTVTAYSNYGAGLAALIVERISGQTFADYAHEHIFQPLGMNKTAILPDLSDNSYVQKKRQETKGYDTKGNLLSKDHFITSIYPTGAATGTLKDLEKFAQALLARKTLFERPETWNTLYTASSTYPDTDIIRNAHGFWANEYGTTVLGHGGNTAGATSRIMLDLEHGIGYVVMTNQGAEQNYNFQMPELVFGPRKTASKETQEQFSPGYYRTLRNFNQGPLAIFKMIPASADYLQEPSDDQRLPNNFWTIYQSQVGQKIEDYVKEHEKTTAAMETAVFDKDSTIYQGNFGYMDKEKGIKADNSSVFDWGSVTKLTVWIAVMQLWEQGKIDLEEDIKTYLPENFLKNLHFDKAITMLDLMNHQTGFDESLSYTKGDKNIEENLRMLQPVQSFEPGTVTSYSNYGAGLASLIVERISGQTFADYTHEHIFQPLGMDKTALLPDLSDNPYVQKKRQESKAYDTKGNSLGTAFYEYGLYSIGQAAGTLEDLQKFAQALLGRKVLFERPETWNTLYNPTSTYPGTDIARNAHGFWINEYGVSIIGHGGNTDGFSSRLMLDLESGIGYIVMTNQSMEENYNYQMPELVFGKRKTADKETQKQFTPGYYLSPRTYLHGPLSFLRLMMPSIEKIDNPAQNRILSTNFWTIYKSKGKVTIPVAVVDYEKISAFDFYKDYIILGLGILGIVYSFGTLIISLLLGAYRLISRKTVEPTDRTWKVWNLLTSLGILAVLLNLLMIMIPLMSDDLDSLAPWRYMLFAALGLLLTAAALLPLFRKSREKFSNGRLFLTAMTSLSALAVVANILYWSLYQWWVL